ncbi:hypothetical protein AXF42_Ash007361 [Apostasia shenzhenica]|uniref:Uncharacterized protein n=1 Tax=Apostasia shenzhenica TaxID=1088818 RepID=A0A2I0B9Y9_9ASPA|nr:hypothetical protein AXF42_Ash007361 [Apostasia shenzhenica]
MEREAESSASDHRPRALQVQEVRSLLGQRKQRIANCIQAFHRICMDTAFSRVCRILCLGLGQSAKNTPHVLCQLPISFRRLLPNCIICNTPQFIPTLVNHDLRYISWDEPPGQHPRFLAMDDVPGMIRSNAPFARKFKPGDQALDVIDMALLGRKNGSFVNGGWCSRSSNCSQVGDTDMLKPGPGAQRLAALLQKMVRLRMLDQEKCT